MKLGVISPSRGVGQTTVAVMLATAMVDTFKRPTILAHSGGNSDAMLRYCVPHPDADPTRSLTQIVRLLESDSLDAGQVVEYAIELRENLFLLDSDDKTIEDSEYNKLLNFVTESLDNSQDLVIDLQSEVYDDATQEALKALDFICVVLPQDNVGLDKYKAWRESNFFKWLPNSSLMFVVNRYNPTISALRQITGRLGVKHSKMCKMGYNPLITKFCNSSKLPSVVNLVLNKDPRVVSLNADLHECMQVIGGVIGMQCRWR